MRLPIAAARGSRLFESANPLSYSLFEQLPPVGDQATGLYSESLQGRDSMSRSARAERRSESAVRVRGARIAMVTGAVLILLGGTGFSLSKTIP